MQRAGRAVANGVLRDIEEIGGWPAAARMLVVVGKGHNGGDALVAAHEILRQHADASADVLLVSGGRSLRPLALRSWQTLQDAFPDRVRPVALRGVVGAYAMSLDGLFGFNFRPPLDAANVAALARVNALKVLLRAAIDLPSGLNAPEAFRADFTYATGAVKTPLLGCASAGRLRYLDLGFFDQGEADGGSATERPEEAAFEGNDCVLTAEVLAPLRGWRDPHTDKRREGHLFVMAGSRNYPGAALMTVTAALRSGAGLVTAFVPESLVGDFAAQVPEAIWVGWPETPEGGLALEGRHLLLKRIERATALVIGPGIGREAETLALAAEVAKTTIVPVLLDADALQPEVLTGANGQLVLTPHAGEFLRIAGTKELRSFAAERNAVVVLKGPITRVSDGANVAHSFFGGPVLARGGSGDLLAGVIGAQLAASPADPWGATCRGVAWHGLAADALARARGAVAVRTTDLLDFLSPALRMPS